MTERENLIVKFRTNKTSTTKAWKLEMGVIDLSKLENKSLTTFSRGIKRNMLICATWTNPVQLEPLPQACISNQSSAISAPEPSLFHQGNVQQHKPKKLFYLEVHSISHTSRLLFKENAIPLIFFNIKLLGKKLHMLNDTDTRVEKYNEYL